MINIMQNYYGLAIRSNRNDSYGMKKNVGVILFHCIEINDESSCHSFFPQTGIHAANGSMTNLKGLTHVRPILQYQSGFMIFRNQYHKLVYLSGTLLRK